MKNRRASSQPEEEFSSVSATTSGLHTVHKNGHNPYTTEDSIEKRRHLLNLGVSNSRRRDITTIEEEGSIRLHSHRGRASIEEGSRRVVNE